MVFLRKWSDRGPSSRRPRPHPEQQPWLINSSLSPQQIELKDRLIIIVRLLNQPGVPQPKSRYVATMSHNINTFQSFGELYQYIAEETLYFHSPLHGEFPHAAPPITEDIRKLINWCNDALLLLPGTPKAHRAV